jgi:hypothetical protein
MVSVIMITGSAKAETNLQIQKLQVEIMPEYDRPDVLVIYHIALPPQTTLPVHMTLHIPAAAGKPTDVSMEGLDGNLYKMEYTTQKNGDWLDITFSSMYPTMQIEYYDPSLVKKDQARQFLFRWMSNYDVLSMQVVLQQPINSYQITIDPSLGAGQKEDDGLTYFNKNFGQVNSGTGFSMNIQYLKPDDTLSFAVQPVIPESPLNSSSQSSSMSEYYQPLFSRGFLQIFLAALLGLVTIFGLVALLSGAWRPASLASGASRRARIRAAVNRSAIANGNDIETNIYCPQCGKLARTTDIFCRSCGHRFQKQSSKTKTG